MAGVKLIVIYPRPKDIEAFELKVLPLDRQRSPEGIQHKG
jgi:hypothetical protein